MIEKCVQQVPIAHPYMPEQGKFMEYAQRIWENRWLTHGGPLVTELQERLKKRLQAPGVVVFANGHLALDCALKALGLHDGEAITTPFTYISTSQALSMNGLKPVFCDIKESDCTIDEEKIESLITEKTKAIVPVHVYGFPCNVKGIQKIADRHGLKVVYDAAHVFGVSVKGQGIGTFGDASMFSFHATKVFHSVEGGAVSFRELSLEDKLVSAKNFGMVAAEEADSISFNAKMTELCAAMGLANLDILDEQIAKRKILVEQYLSRLRKVKGIKTFSWDRPGVTYNYAYFPVVFDEAVLRVSRDEIAERLYRDYNVQVRKYFYPLISDLHCYSKEHDSKKTPVAKRISDQVLTLPLYVELTDEQVNYICGAIEEIIKQ